MLDVNLVRDSFGRLVYTDAAGKAHVGVVPVHAFPISAPDAGLALVSAEGYELLWIPGLHDVPAAVRALLEQELAQREFMPQIKRIRHVASFATPSAWQVETDRGDYELILKSEDDIRRLPNRALLIAASCGIHFLIADVRQLDRESRRLLDRFL